jgi:hypothetical protein
MQTAEAAESAWFDKLTMSAAHPEPVEGCDLCVLCG